MRKSLALLLLPAILGGGRGIAPGPGDDVPPGIPEERIQSEVRVTETGARVLVHEVWLNASVEAVFDAHATAEGWTAWAAPSASVDLRAGGEILTHYTGEVGDAGTNRLTIVNVVPNELMTLRADVSKNWPEVMRNDAEHLANVLVFDEVAEGWTHLRSFGVGYGDAHEYEELLEFFRTANAGLYEGLIRYVEDGQRATWSE